MKARTVFNRVVKRLRDGTGRAANNMSCLYLTDDGRKCAVGIFIPDGHPGQHAVGGLDTLLREHPDLQELEPFKSHRGLLRRLQSAHDISMNWTGNTFNNMGEDDLKCAARAYHLEYKAPKKGK